VFEAGGWQNLINDGFEPKLPHAARRIDGSNAQEVCFAKLRGELLICEPISVMLMV